MLRLRFLVILKTLKIQGQSDSSYEQGMVGMRQYTQYTFWITPYTVCSYSVYTLWCITLSVAYTRNGEPMARELIIANN